MEEIRRWSHVYENGAPRFIEHYNSTTHKATIFVPERTCHVESHDCGDGVTGLYCSECGNYIDENDNYCPQCGARVIEETPISDGTCRITATATDGLMTDDPKKRFWLSCEHDVGMYGLDRKPNYCPQCGAKVVE